VASPVPFFLGRGVCGWYIRGRMKILSAAECRKQAEALYKQAETLIIA
jgi:hypothetical protein